MIAHGTRAFSSTTVVFWSAFGSSESGEDVDRRRLDRSAEHEPRPMVGNEGHRQRSVVARDLTEILEDGEQGDALPNAGGCQIDQIRNSSEVRRFVVHQQEPWTKSSSSEPAVKR